MKKLILVLAALVALAAPAAAQTEPGTIPNAPLLSITRLSVGVGASYAFYSGDEGNRPSFAKEWEGGLFAAYALTPNVAAVGSVVYGLDSKVYRSSVGVRVSVFRGSRGVQ